jgi:aminoglycoside phosphotransferase (APT) family kinase protein
LFDDDQGLAEILDAFRLTPDTYIGHGGEAIVFALDDARVLRVLHAGTTDDVARRQALVDDLARGSPPFALPRALEIGERDGRVYVVEQRLPGRSVLAQLRDGTGPRAALIEAHLDAAAALGGLFLAPRATFGDLLTADAIVTTSWHEYLEARAAANLARSLPEFRGVDAAPLSRALPDTDRPAFVHLDAFAGNMLTDGTAITAVVDFSLTSIAGDGRMNPLAAAVYLAAPDITPFATRADLDVANGWLRNAGLQDWFEPAQRWLAAYWTFAFDDPNVLRWTRSVLLS